MTRLISKKLLRKREHLISNFIEGDDATFIEKHAGLFDEYFCKSFEKSGICRLIDFERNPFAIIALGGYGRKELSVFSDIDILFLFNKKVPQKAKDLIRELIYPLWDIGIEVGHATRTISETIKLAKDDLETLTAILDSRFICGVLEIYSDLVGLINNKIIVPGPDKIVSILVEKSRERHRHFGDSAYLLEPNLKEGQGGLRDYHTMIWIAQIKSGLLNRCDLKYHGYLLQNEYNDFLEAVRYIANVRCRLHHLAGRKYDQLYFEYQTRMAKRLKFEKTEGNHPVEIFLGRLHQHMELVKQHHLMFIAELGFIKQKRNLSEKSGKQTKTDGIVVANDMLNFSSPKAVADSPLLLIEIFKKSAELSIPISTEARRIIRESSHLADDAFRSLKPVVCAFEYILKTPAFEFNVLNEMLNTGFLEALIPEYGKIINRIQYNNYHIYPVARHSLYTVRTIKKIGTVECPDSEPLYIKLYNELSDKKNILLWAALLHDIGKGEQGKGHAKRGSETARKILSRVGYDSEMIETCAFLIKEHLFLIKTATRRDINDEETAIFCAARIKEIDRLKMLYLLTVADSMSTGPKAWNEWIMTLLRDLFIKILHLLEKGELTSKEALESVERKKREVVSSAKNLRAAQELGQLLRLMSPRYLLYSTTEDIIAHAKLFRRMKSARFVMDVSKEMANTRTVTVCAKDGPGLFYKIAGVFTLNNINILDAQIYTWRNNVAIDIFRVTPPPDRIFEDEKWSKVKRNLDAVLSNRLDISAALEEKVTLYNTSRWVAADRPLRVKVDNEGSSFFTIIEVFAYDYPGLLFDITNILFMNNLDIWIAKISTKVDQVVDVFYVRDVHGEKVDTPESITKIKDDIINVIEKNTCTNKKQHFYATQTPSEREAI